MNSRTLSIVCDFGQMVLVPNSRTASFQCLCLEGKHNLTMSWNYSATSHGKDPVDGIGGSAYMLSFENANVGDLYVNGSCEKRYFIRKSVADHISWLQDDKARLVQPTLAQDKVSRCIHWLRCGKHP